MIQKTWARLFPNPTFYGWAIVGLCFLATTLSSPGQSFAISLYIEHVIDSLGVSRLQVSSLYGAMTLMAAFCLPAVGSLADSISGRRFITLNLILLALAIAFFGTVQNLVMLAIAFFFLRLLGQGAIGLGTLTVIVLWFRRFRSRALAVGGLGYAFGELIFPATIVGLIAWVGWRQSLWLMAGIYLIVFVPLLWWLLRPRQKGEPFDGGATNEAVDDNAPSAPTEISFSLQEALKTPTFWGLLIAVAILPLVVTAVIFHQVALFNSVGWGAEFIPISFVFFAITSVATSYIAGILLETIPSRFGVTVGMLCAVAALMVAAYLQGSPLAVSLLYGILLGASSGILTAANNIIWPDYYGIESLGAIKGVVSGVRNGATAAGPPLVAWLIGSEELFLSAFWVLAAMSLFAAILALFLPPPKSDPQAD